MQQITATQLRTKSKDLFEALERGKSVDLIKKSKIIGEIRPKKEEKYKIFNAKRFMKNAKAMNLPKLTNKEMEKNYREHMMKKYGKYLP